MKTFNQIKSLIGFCQTDEFFLEYLQMLQAAGVIHPLKAILMLTAKLSVKIFMIALPVCMALKQRKHYGNRTDTNDGGRR
jgi:hypothetical protein